MSLIRRQYATGLRDLGDREWFAPIGERPQRWNVPLASTDEAVANRSAVEIARDVAAQGWDRAGTRVPREFTVGIFWLEAPMAVTYTTLFTLPKAGAVPAAEREANRLRFALVEPDPVFRTALCHWLARIPGCTCVGWESELPWFTQPRRRAEVDVLLVNRLAPAFVGGRFRPGRAAGSDIPPVFGYGVYPTSDDIFASVSGVEAGYFLRRRKLGALVEPLSAAFSAGQFQPEAAGRTLRRYFQNLFTADAASAAQGSGLTTRERQILASIQRGLRDKEIATSLGISPLTVHTHLKHIFHKLDAHTRTEAVVKFLEK